LDATKTDFKNAFYPPQAGKRSIAALPIASKYMLIPQDSAFSPTGALMHTLAADNGKNNCCRTAGSGAPHEKLRKR
jgi:hypothetical protein